jgi:predicted alpha/beta superfamily hydrolase
MRTIRTFRIGFFSAILVCLLVLEFAAKSTEVISPDSQLRFAHTLTGDIHLHNNFHSRFLPTARDIIVYLPPGYEQAESRRYPVLYMQDGQNIFDTATSFFVGRERHMDERAEALIAQHAIEPLIIVGIYSAGLERINEYTPTRPKGSSKGGQADLYGRMLVEEIIPFIDAQYRTWKGPAHTGLAGSSLGGLATLYLGLKYANTFGKLAITSPAAYWDDEMIVRYVQSLPSRTDQRISLAIGTEETAEFLSSTRALRQALISKGWKEGINLGYMEASRAQHSPDDRALRGDHLLRFLFPSVNLLTNDKRRYHASTRSHVCQLGGRKSRERRTNFAIEKKRIEINQLLAKLDSAVRC